MYDYIMLTIALSISIINVILLLRIRSRYMSIDKVLKTTPRKPETTTVLFKESKQSLSSDNNGGVI